MKDELISYETAKLANQAGFDKETLASYLIKDGGILNDQIGKLGSYDVSSRNPSYGYTHQDVISAPTQSLLQRWLREVCGINITIFTSVEKNISGYTPKVHGKLMWKHCKTYEEALEAGLQEALKLIKK